MRKDIKTRAAARTVMIPGIATPAVRRLVDQGTPGREQNDGRRYSHPISHAYESQETRADGREDPAA